MRAPIAVGVAALLVAAGFATLAPSASAHVVSDTKSYESHCDAFVVLCVLTEDDPTGGRLCEGGTCRFGGAIWDEGLEGEVTNLHAYDADGLDVRAVIHDDVGEEGDFGDLCVARTTSDTDPDGSICNDPQWEPAVAFCGSSPWLEEAVERPFDSGDFDDDGDDDSADWVGVFVGGPVSQAWTNRPPNPLDPWDDPMECNPLAAGATRGEVELFVRE